MARRVAAQDKALTASEAKARLRAHADPAKAEFLKRFFRTGPGEYAEGDRFLGVTVPLLRRVARDLRKMPLPEVAKLLASPMHEDRLLALVLLAYRAQRADAHEGRVLADFYLRHRTRVNNWDLVDTSAEHVLGPFLDELTSTLVTLSASKSVWDRRIAILAHMREIRKGETKRFLAFARRFLRDEHDLIHKAVGWLLREAGKADPDGLRRFLDQHAKTMPRTMLRYSLEKFGPAERKKYMTRTRDA